MLKRWTFLFVFCKTCICLKFLENIHIPVNMIDRLDITDEYSVKCVFILNTIIFIDAALNILSRKFWKCNVLWFYLFGQGVPNETKGMITLKYNLAEMLKVIELIFSTCKLIDSMTGAMLKEQYISYLPLLQTLYNILVIMLLHTFNIISLIPSMCKGNYVILSAGPCSAGL